MIRRSYLISRLVILGVLWLFCALAFDPILRWTLQKAGSAALGAKVEIGKLRTGFFPPRIELRRFAAADPGEPMRNLVQFDSARFGLDGRPLLQRKFVISDAQLGGLEWGTARTTSGALPKAPPSRAAAKLKEWGNKSKDVSFAALTGAKEKAKERFTLQPDDLRSVQLAKDLEKRLPEEAKAWQKRAKDFGADKKLNDIQSLANQLQSGDPLTRARKAADLLKQVDQFKKDADQMRRDIESDAAKTRADVEAVQKAKAADLDALRSKLQLPSLDPEKLSGYLLGPETAERLSKVLRLLEAARKKMPAKGAKPAPAPEARRGATIEFPKEHSDPAFWLKHLSLSGTAEVGGPLAFSGEADDFSSNPPLVGRPSRIDLNGAQGARKARLSASLDHTRQTPRDEVDFEYAGLPMAAMTAGDPSSLAVTVGPGVAAVSGKVVLDGDALTGTVRFRQSGVKITPATGAGGATERLAAAAFASIHDIDAVVTLGGTLEEPHFGLSSNLGSALANGLKAAVGKEAQARLADAQAQIAKLVDGRVAGLQNQLNGSLGSALGGLGMDRINGLQDQIKKQATGGLRLPKLFR